MGELNDLGVKHTTDKSTITHHYLDTYEHYLRDWREKEFIMWEIGVAGGASLRMWREYFPKASVIGIDINPDCTQHGDVFIGNQTDPAFLDNLIASQGLPSIIVSDGSHVGDEEVFSFKHLFPKLPSGGMYFLEDCATFYIEHYAGPPEANGRSRAFNFFSGLMYDIDVAGRGCCGNAQFCIDHPTTEPPVPEFSRVLESMHIHCSLYVFKRR